LTQGKLKLQRTSGSLSLSQC